MPVNPTFPGVYIEEIPSGVRTITGVATSITAFIGRALRGPTDQEPIETDRAVTINSFADFERIYGGLWEKSTLGFAVRDFFLNGGNQAIIVRLYNEDKTAGAKKPKTKLTMGDIVLEAANPGTWGQYLRATVEPGTSDEIAKSLGLTDKGDLFNLTVSDTSPGGIVEKFQNLSVKSSPRRIDNVLKA
jgi:phage tail sheath protein FI